MSIEGRIAVDINFTDSATVGGASSVKKIQLVDATQYSSGKVAIVTGTCGTAAVTIEVNPTTYLGPDGNAVAFTAGVSRVAFASSGANLRSISDNAGSMKLTSSLGMVSVGINEPGLTLSLTVAPPTLQSANTAAYTAVFYGT